MPKATRGVSNEFEKYVNDNWLLRNIFSHFCFLQPLVADGGLLSDFDKYKWFCKKYGFCHIFSPLYHLQNNDMTERLLINSKRHVQNSIKVLKVRIFERFKYIITVPFIRLPTILPLYEYKTIIYVLP